MSKDELWIDADMAASARPTADCVARHATLCPEHLTRDCECCKPPDEDSLDREPHRPDREGLWPATVAAVIVAALLFGALWLASRHEATLWPAARPGAVVCPQ